MPSLAEHGLHRALALGLALALTLLAGGCARLPAIDPIAPSEEELVARSFRGMMAERAQCPCCLDAEASVTYDSIWSGGTLNGYLQAMHPSSLKFVAVGPLDRPLAIFVTNGDTFRFIVVNETKEYVGPTAGKSYAKYAPRGFRPQHGFAWLTGRLFDPAMKISAIGRDREGKGYWLTLQHDNGEASRLLFADKQGVVLRHIVLDAEGSAVFNVLYDEYTSGPCPLPGKVTVTSSEHEGSMVLRMSAWLPDVVFGAEEFLYEAPASFQRVEVE